MRRLFGRKLDGAAQLADCFRGRGLGQATVNDADQKPGGEAERRDFVVPTTEQVMGVVVVRQQGEGPLLGVPSFT